MAGIFQDLLGTTRAFFKVGISGVRLKNSSGNLLVRNTGDTADANITAAEVFVSGDVVQLNSDAVGSGADWTYSLQRPATGMTSAQTITLPAGLGTSGQVIQTDGAGNLSFVTAGGSTASSEKIDTTSLAFGSTSPLTMFSTGAADIIDSIEVVIDTAFNGTPSLSIGVTGTTSKYLAATDVDLTQAAGTVFVIHPGLVAGGVEALIATYSAGGASAGAARLLVHYATPA